MTNIEYANVLAQELATAASPVSVLPITEDGRSWILYAPKWSSLDANEFDKLWGTRPADRPQGLIAGAITTFPRYTQAFGRDYAFSGQVAKAVPFANAPDKLQEVVRRLQGSALLREHNSALVNYYAAEEGDYIGPHSDDERGLCANQPIVSLTWCTAQHVRRFRLTPRKSTKDAITPPACRDARLNGVVVNLGNGDLVVMGGECQRTHKHEIMKPGRCLAEKVGKRINITFRLFV